MIKRISRKNLNIEKYDTCIAQSLQSKIFGFSWYLDIVADNWDIYVLNDYEAVMPVPWRKKYGIKYVYQPLWTLQLGFFSLEKEDENEFLIKLFDDFKYVDLRMNPKNYSSLFTGFAKEKTMQIISLENSYEEILKNYNRNRRRELTKAKKHDLVERWNESPEKLLTLFKENVGKRVQHIKTKEYQQLLQLMRVCIDKKLGELLCILDKNNKLVSAGFFLNHQQKITELVCSSDFSNRENGANTFMNDRAIFKYQSKFKLFDFGGSSMKNIRKYYLSFGAIDEKYQSIHCNKLPKFVRFFKQ